MTKKISGFAALAQQGVLMPQESVLEISKLRKELFIGIPKETSFQENRVPLVPESVALLVSNGHDLLIETGAGNNAHFTDSDYSEAGAQIAYTSDEIYKKCDLVLKVAPPSLEELDKFKDKQSLMSILQIGMQPEGYINKLSSKKITALAYEYIKDETDLYPVIQAMSEIVGSAAILIASEYMSNTTGGKGELLGGISGVPPTEVMILGAGTVGEFAARAALGLGANVKIFDDSLYKLRRLQKNLGSRVYTSTLNPSTLLKSLRTCDVIIGAILGKEGRSPVIITDEMVSEMRFGSVIIDVSIDQGGCFETSEVTNHNNPIFRKYGVIHYCVPNIASRVARTASCALSNIFTPILLNMGDEGGMDELLWKDKYARNAAYLYRGTVTNKYVAEFCNLPFRDLNLLMASRF
jgi:alanine dehydrogenase